ncbi:trans-aconitate 2-methyltransferase, partial [Acinetobacter baumannii]|nr:trans-aconitate 2-methyltransferase [Acinetobacter baumannii]
LRPHCSNVDVWRTTYFHPLAGGHAAVVEWFKGSALRPFVAPLDVELKAGFYAAYLQAISQAYPALDDGTVLLPFPRLFIGGSR